MKKTLQKVIAATVLVSGLFMTSTGIAKADNSFLVIDTLSLQFDDVNEKNAFTPGVGWERSPTSKVSRHAGTLADSFRLRPNYGGFNYATRRMLNGKLRF